MASEIDRELKFCGLHHRQPARLLTLENPRGVETSSALGFCVAEPRITAANVPSADHFVGASQQCRRNFKCHRLRSPEIDHKLKDRGL